MLHTQAMQAAFHANFNRKAEFVVRAPGRVNLIGEHTDYNEGYVLPMAIDRAAWIALAPRGDGMVRIRSQDRDETVSFDLEALGRGTGWAEYIKGMAHELRVAGKHLRGWDGILAGDVPIGAGLSSSAAVELAAGRAFAAASGLNWAPAEMAALAQRAESQWVGVNCGIMDQMVSAAAEAGHALFLDCRSLDYQHVPIPATLAVVVLDTSTRRGLVDSAYNERRSQCENAARHFKVRALRDLSLSALESEKADLPETVYRRARHVLSENQRVLRAVEALRADNPAGLGQTLNEGHASLRDDFEVSGPALDHMVQAAQAQPGCYGARMTGAGFGGCALALVEQNAVEQFVPAVAQAYKSKTGLDGQMYVCRASEGASLEYAA